MSVVLLEPSHWIMQMRQFQNLKRHAEGDRAGVNQPTATAVGEAANAD